MNQHNDDARDVPDALDRRIDAALARHFAVPVSVDTLAARLRPPVPKRRAWPIVLTLAAAAAVVVFALRSAAPAPDVQHPRALPRALPLAGSDVASEAPLEPEVAAADFCSLVGPLEDSCSAPDCVHNPDLARLYRAMDDCQRSESVAFCDENDLLAERMSETYGQPLELRPGAAGRLHGPFASAEWPTGMIMTGSIATSASTRSTVVLVADRLDVLDCCVHPHLAEGLGLNKFTANVGDMVLTEITPLEKPEFLHLLQ